MKCLSIAFLSRDLPSLHPNGVSQQVHWMANELIRRGHRITVFSMDPKPENALYPVIRDTKPVGKLGRLFRPAIFFSNQNYSDFDLIHAHGDNYRIHTRTPMIRTFYGSALWEALYDPRPLYKIRQAFFYALEWLAAFRSHENAGISKTSQKAIPRIRHVIPCGIDSSMFRPGGSKTSFPSVLFIGNLSGRKGGHALISIFLREVLPKYPEARLILVTGEKGPDHPNIEIHPHLSATRLVSVLQSAWILCMASSYEGFGVPVIESWACGTAVLTTPHRGVREIAENGKNVLWSPRKLLGESICRLFQYPALREMLSQNGLLQSRQYTIPKTVDRYEELYGRFFH